MNNKKSLEEHHNDFIESHMPDVEYHAKRIADSLPLGSISGPEDFHAAGIHGINKAIASWDPNVVGAKTGEKASFLTHVRNNIYNEMLRQRNSLNTTSDWARNKAKQFEKLNPSVEKPPVKVYSPEEIAAMNKPPIE